MTGGVAGERVRAEVLGRLEQDLVGPEREDERLSERPSDRYLLGILYPPGELVSKAEDDTNHEEPARPSVEPAGETGDVPIYRSVRPSSFGLSFRVAGRQPRLGLRLTGARYARIKPESDEGGSFSDLWQRIPVEIATEIAVLPGYRTEPIDGTNLTLATRVTRADETFAVTAVVTNTASGRVGTTWTEEASLFQARLEINPVAGSTIVPRPLASSAVAEEDRSARLLYRTVHEYAVGHTCAAGWTLRDGHAESIHTAWMPDVRVPSFDPEGSQEFATWAAGSGPSAAWLADASDDDLGASMRELAAAYRAWISGQRDQADDIPDEILRATARQHLLACDGAADAIEEGVTLIASDQVVRHAFQLANRAMVMQRDVAPAGPGDLRWRPFQLAFQLTVLPSLAQEAHNARSLMDLLWFPTGGGKTEAYLGLIAFLIFHRRLRTSAPDQGAGVAAIMRYTLRVLTAQQFQRAAAMIAACEALRFARTDLGATPFSIGLWIGGEGTPNTVAQAVSRPEDLRVLVACPRCGDMLTNPTPTQRRQFCRNGDCIFATRPVPIHVIDEDVYEARPSLLLATVDKFAQITRQVQASALFSLDRRFPPPELILQDELHLVSGPLGTIAGLYEIAIDEFCAWSGSRPKVVGSTATIRRAREQVVALFDREVRTFPPSGLDQNNSGFAVHDAAAPGRRYVGVPTTGRSPKFALQAVLASLLQSGEGTSSMADPTEVDPFWTCVGYFNSIRELGGAVVLVEDDVRRSIARLAERRGERARRIETPSEVTSRVPTTEIPELLEQLGRSFPDSEVDVVLASNMISVGVDIPRLGLMVVNGQPKTTAEYIQATSRVGRQSVPGLIVVLYNVQRPRDRSRYESFQTWHQALYRDVEPTSVTPFAPRARDRALHAPLVALLRLLYPPRSDSPVLGTGREKEVSSTTDIILRRAEAVDPGEVEATRDQLRRLLDDWASRSRLRDWWWSKGHEDALMIGAEDNASLAATRRVVDAWPTPNSMRDVEPTTRFRMVPGLRGGSG